MHSKRVFFTFTGQLRDCEILSLKGLEKIYDQNYSKFTAAFERKSRVS